MFTFENPILVLVPISAESEFHVLAVLKNMFDLKTSPRRINKESLYLQYSVKYFKKKPANNSSHITSPDHERSLASNNGKAHSSWSVKQWAAVRTCRAVIRDPPHPTWKRPPEARYPIAANHGHEPGWGRTRQLD